MKNLQSALLILVDPSLLGDGGQYQVICQAMQTFVYGDCYLESDALVH